MDAWHETPTGKPRARGLGILLQGNPGANNAITDVDGVAVGYTTLIEGASVRTGVTAILPRPPAELRVPVFAGCHSLNGNGELTGTLWMEESGRMDCPITITNTHACGIARNATVKWMVERVAPDNWVLPVAGETFDGHLNDINGFHVHESHVMSALDCAVTGPIDEGSVGGGTGMVCYGYKGGSGTSSRLVEVVDTTVTIGAFVQANFGRPHQLTIAGVPVGRMLGTSDDLAERGSIIAVIATDAPLLPHQLKRLARRIGLGVGRSGAISGHGSGDIFMAFSTANTLAHQEAQCLSHATFVPDAHLDSLFEAVIQSVDEAILNALVANEPMSGFNSSHVENLPRDEVVRILANERCLADQGL